MKEKNSEKRKNTWIRTMEGCIVLICLCGISLFYVWQHVSITRLGYQIHKEALRVEELENEKASLQSMISSIEAPASIQKKVLSDNPELSMSKRPNVIRIKI